MYTHTHTPLTHIFSAWLPIGPILRGSYHARDFHRGADRLFPTGGGTLGFAGFPGNLTVSQDKGQKGGGWWGKARFRTQSHISFCLQGAPLAGDTLFRPAIIRMVLLHNLRKPCYDFSFL